MGLRYPIINDIRILPLLIPAWITDATLRADTATAKRMRCGRCGRRGLEFVSRTAEKYTPVAVCRVMDCGGEEPL